MGKFALTALYNLKAIQEMLVQLILLSLVALHLLSIVLLLQGRKAIIMGNWFQHRNFMLLAILLTGIAIILTAGYFVLTGIPSFSGDGFVRLVGWTLLTLHAWAIIGLVVLLPWTLYRIARHLILPHKIMARWTIRVWLFMSGSGAAVCALLFFLTLPR